MEVKLLKIEIEVAEIGEHIFNIILDGLLKRKRKAKVVRLNITGIYSKGVKQKTESFNLMVGDSVSLNIKKMRKNGKK